VFRNFLIAYTHRFTLAGLFSPSFVGCISPALHVFYSFATENLFL
jgi:hypothetical protein